MVFETISVHMDSMGDVQNGARDQVFVNLALRDVSWNSRSTELRAKVDNGAQGNVLPLRIYQKMFPDGVDNDWKAHWKIPGEVVSQAGLLWRHAYQPVGRVHGHMCLPADTEGDTVLCHQCPWSSYNRSTIIRSNQNHLAQLRSQAVTRPVADKAGLIAQYPDCFTEIGKFEGQYHITLDPTVQPVIHQARGVPFALKPDMKTERDSMEQQGVIRKVSEGEPTELVNSLVYRRKANGQLRICLDPKDLNKPPAETTMSRVFPRPVSTCVRTERWNLRTEVKWPKATSLPEGRAR